MRGTSTVVVVSSLLVAASVAAGPAPKTPASKTKATPAAKTAAADSASSGTTTGTASASDPATPVNSSGDLAGTGGPAAASPDLTAVKPEDMPTAVRMRRLEQKTQALKERAWQLKARVQMLKEQVLGGGIGAQAVVEHANEMGASFRLTKLIYALDGTQVFVRTDDAGESLYKTRSFDVFAGPISPGNHNLAAIATYRGHGYGVFEYLSKYTFTARGAQTFIAGEGKITKVDCRGFEQGGATTPLEKRSAVECKVSEVQPDKPADSVAAPAGPGAVTTPSGGGAAAPAQVPATTPAPPPAPAGATLPPGK